MIFKSRIIHCFYIVFENKNMVLPQCMCKNIVVPQYSGQTAVLLYVDRFHGIEWLLYLSTMVFIWYSNGILKNTMVCMFKIMVLSQFTSFQRSSTQYYGTFC